MKDEIKEYSKFIMLHMLRSVPLHSFNKDKDKRIKTHVFGGTRRIRISSQCKNYAVREHLRDLYKEDRGTRTKLHKKDIIEELIEENDNDEIKKIQEENAEKIIEIFSKVDKEGTKQLFYFDKSELNKIDKLVEILRKRKKEVTKSECKNLLSKVNDSEYNDLNEDKISSIDLAVFGRMATTYPECSVNSSIQCANLFTVNEAYIEKDFFTASDDRIKRKGSAFMNGDNDECASGTYYEYIAIDFEKFIKNLNGNIELAKKYIKNIIESYIKCYPKGKQTKFAAHNLPSYVLVEKSDGTPRDLSKAFEKPIKNTGNGFTEPAIKALEKCKKVFNKFQLINFESYIINIEKEDDKNDLDGLLKFVVAKKEKS